ncbi:MAG: ABC transporter substrate-binding protein [Clostridiales bacterium]|nr:ABC transporter substrate-binding protein [Clostridiales bacterium]MDY5530274.1 ABC transporter substrate-binding protein [Eubacteriales bacterium]
MKQKKLLMLIAMVLVVVLCASVLTACKKDKGNDDENVTKPGTGWEDPKMYTMREYTSQMPSQWCTILSSDNVNNEMESYFTSAFYEFNYKFDANGKIVPGAYTVEYSAATKLEDVTKKYAGQYGLAADAEKGQAFAMTLRNDLKWDDGTPIKAADFVYSMSQQLSPKYLFATASNYYSGNYVIHNAQNYVKQGQKGMFPAYSVMKEYNVADDAKLIYSTTNSRVAEKGFTPEVIVAAFGIEGMTVEKINALNGKSLADIKKDAALNETWEALLGAWKTDPNEELDFFETEYEYPAMDFSEVGYFVGDNEYELVMVIDGTLNPLDAEGNLTYEAGYYFSGWPLVKKDLWERCEDQSKTPYANSYCTTLEKSASWGPYKLTNYQDQKTYTVSRNDKWFGYGLPQYANQYQTDAIVTEKIEEWDTAWLAFQKGNLDGIGMDVKIAADYRTSKRAYFTPETWTFDLNIQSNATSRTDKRNNLLLNYADFRKAISLSLDRDDYCAKNNPSSQAALGLLNSMYYYDVENGKVYRESIQAKEAILNAYGATKNADGSWKVGETTYTDIEDALDATTGYNLTLARQLVENAVAQAKKDGKYSDGDEIILTYGIETQTANTDRVKNWFQAAFDNMTKGTSIEGKVKIEYFMFSSATWSKQFEDGEYDLCFSAWGNAPFNPAYLLCETQISEDNRYAKKWDPKTVSVTVKATPDADHKDGIYTYNLEQWRLILQGKDGCPVNFKNFPMEDQLTALGAVETAILKEYYSIPVFSRYSASLMGYKVDYVSYEYNTFMGYGGIRYMTFNYDDTAWAEFVASNNNILNYK